MWYFVFWFNSLFMHCSISRFSGILWLFHSLNRYMRYSEPALMHFSCQRSHAEGICMAVVCLLSLCFCSAILGSLIVCLPECSAQKGNSSWKGFTEVINSRLLPQSQSWLQKYSSSPNLWGKCNKVKRKIEIPVQFWYSCVQSCEVSPYNWDWTSLHKEEYRQKNQINARKSSVWSQGFVLAWGNFSF